MTKVGWLADPCPYTGGAEMTAAEFRAAAPEGVEVLPFPPGVPRPRVDVFVIHNCTSYPPDDLWTAAPAFWYHHDVGPHLSSDQWSSLKTARHICCSPLQRERMGLDAAFIPPAVPLERFRKAAKNVSERKGAVAVGPWMNPAKNPGRAAEWAQGNGGIDFIGGGPFAPADSKQVPYDDLPEVLARYKTFVHLPSEIEPFGRSTVEAWAAGCELVVNRLVGSTYWIREAPEKLETAREDFWDLILNA